GVVTELGVVERQLHERGDRDGAALADHVFDHSFRTGTNVSLSPRHTRSCARCFDCTFCSSRCASCALDTALPLTDRITSPGRRNPADGPSESTSDTMAPVCPDGR